MRVEIRKATLGDAEDILNIYTPYVLSTPISFETELPSLAAFQERMKHIMLHYPYLVCLVDGNVIGYAYSDVHMARAAYRWNTELSIYLKKEAKGLGLGKKLYLTLLDILKEQGFVSAYACITSPNDESISFHKTFGFKEVGYFPKSGYKLDAWHDIIWLEKKINALAVPMDEVIPFPVLAEKKVEDCIQRNR